ncbi:hypothetical protein SI65_03400 [Aspergillus cristatus]|uniref:Xylanolytic transcriptional activator regulatory domain-containing protein n=1 Tax=Aspergillus cristatus TaxID=573508 RepID=A0A1E3BHF4_ASPCR|nr:hypothetical protein SI65_03400 [Aspergillus cristatus]
MRPTWLSWTVTCSAWWETRGLLKLWRIEDNNPLLLSGGLVSIVAVQSPLSKKPPTLQDITDRLERMETLLLRHLEKHSGDEQSGTEEQRTSLEPPDFGSRVEKRSGKPWEVLLRDGERIQYVSNSNLPDLMPDQKHMRPPPSGPGDSEAQCPLENFNLHICVTFPSRSGFSSDAFQFHPDLQLAMRLWSTYVKRVDPVLKILHIPTRQSIVVETIMDPKSASPSQMALVFAIYFAAVTTLDKNEDSSILTGNRHTILDRYRTGLDQALMQTDFLSKPKLLDLQALAIFFTCLRAHDAGRGVWVLRGIAIRLAQSVGLHRDGRALGLSVFETEIRLRLWWHLCLHDSRSPEDHGFELTVDILNQGLRLPLNIQAARLLHPVLGTREQYSADALAAKRRMIQDHTESIKCTYACAKMEFILQLREEIYFSKQKPSSSDPSTTTKPSFRKACDVLERSEVLLNGDISKQFTWLFKTYTQWYALAYTLRCLCVWPHIPEAEGAWNTINKILASTCQLKPLSDSSSINTGDSSIWRCLMLLRSRVLRARTGYQPDSAGMLPSMDPYQEGIGAAGQQQQAQESTMSAEELSEFEALGIQQCLGTVTDYSQGVPLINEWLPEWDAVINSSLYTGDRQEQELPFPASLVPAPNGNTDDMEDEDSSLVENKKER